MHHQLALVISFCLSVVVFAGHPIWESQIEIKWTRDPDMDFNSTAKGRYFAIDPSDEDEMGELWPDATIKYYFEDKTWPERDGKSTREILEKDWIDAWNLWYEEGLPAKIFKYEELSSEQCNGDRSEFLRILFSPAGKMATTVGKQSSSRCTLTDIATGMLNIRANYAHEIGHALGLLHEHQNPYWWDKTNGGKANDGEGIFGSKSWECQNLQDYAKVKAKLEQQWTVDVAAKKLASACKLQAAAVQEGFSAQEYLPFPAPSGRLLNKKTIDWQSLMLYPSGCGGIGDATFDGTDNRMPILKKPDGSLIGVITKPSAEDVKGLKLLYGVTSGLTTKFKSLFDKASKLKNKAKDIKRKDSGCE